MGSDAVVVVVPDVVVPVVVVGSAAPFDQPASARAQRSNSHVRDLRSVVTERTFTRIARRLQAAKEHTY
ncbi:MAG: hypothetical protein ABSG36_16280 [Acidimicrobiales bacterium]